MVRPPLGEHDKMSTLGCHVPLAYRLGRHGPPQVDILSCSPNVGHHFYNIIFFLKILVFDWLRKLEQFLCFASSEHCDKC